GSVLVAGSAPPPWPWPALGSVFWPAFWPNALALPLSDAFAGSVLVAGSAPPFWLWLPPAHALGATASTAINRVLRVHFMHIAVSLATTPAKGAIEVPGATHGIAATCAARRDQVYRSGHRSAIGLVRDHRHEGSWLAF